MLPSLLLMERLAESIQRVVTVGSVNMAILESQATGNPTRWRPAIPSHFSSLSLCYFDQELELVHKKKKNTATNCKVPHDLDTLGAFLHYIQTEDTPIGNIEFKILHRTSSLTRKRALTTPSVFI